jgi:hypothetical protein
MEITYPSLGAGKSRITNGMNIEKNPIARKPAIMDL